LIEVSSSGPRSDEAASPRLKITEIFYSLQGEALFSGLPTVFVRLTGCPLRCGYCDTAYAFSGGQWRTVDEILTAIGHFDTRYVCVTGGEPLAQSRCHRLLTELCDAGYSVSLETSGAIDISGVDARVCRVVDIKTPGSGECDKNRWENLATLRSTDAVKFVICNRGDYEWSRAVLDEHSEIPCTVFFSPSYEDQPAGALADWILEDQLRVRMQVQLHKMLWGDVAGR
jgi:7-carboxy-7-deazaguanine synthase